MKTNLIWILPSALLLAGCCSYRETTCTDFGRIRCEDGETALGTMYVENVSYRIFGLIPFWTGSFSDDYEKYPSGGKGGPNRWFRDDATLENNIRALHGEMKRVGSTRIRSLVTQKDETSAWSFFILNRKRVRTSCTVLPPEPPPAP